MCLCLVAAATAAPSPDKRPPGSYLAPEPFAAPLPVQCGPDQVLQLDGTCATPIVTRNILVFTAPAQPQPLAALPQALPAPRVEHNVIFIRAPEAPAAAAAPLVIPPPQQRNVVYILSKRPEAQQQQVIDIPAQNQAPEVYFVNYNDENEDLQLPGGFNLQSALAQANNLPGEVIGQPQDSYNAPQQVVLPQPFSAEPPSGLYGTPN